MQINPKLISQLKEKNINLDLIEYSQKLSDQIVQKRCETSNDSKRNKRIQPTETSQQTSKQFKIRVCSNDQDLQLGVSQNLANSQTQNQQQQFWAKMEEELEEFQSQGFDEQKLAEILGCSIEQLQVKRQAKLQVNLEYNCMDQVSEFMPRLQELKLNSSVIPSLRDLGTKLNKLQVL